MSLQSIKALQQAYNEMCQEYLIMKHVLILQNLSRNSLYFRSVYHVHLKNGKQ